MAINYIEKTYELIIINMNKNPDIYDPRLLQSFRKNNSFKSVVSMDYDDSGFSRHFKVLNHRLKRKTDFFDWIYNGLSDLVKDKSQYTESQLHYVSSMYVIYFAIHFLLVKSWLKDEYYPSLSDLSFIRQFLEISLGVWIHDYKVVTEEDMKYITSLLLFILKQI